MRGNADRALPRLGRSCGNVRRAACNWRWSSLCLRLWGVALGQRGDLMQRALPIYFTLAAIGASLVACGGAPDYVDTQSRGISADIDAVHMNGPTIDNPAGTNDLPDQPNRASPPNGARPLHI